MQIYVLAFIGLCIGFSLEEFVLIKPMLTLDQSDPLSRRVETLAIWVPAVGMALCGATMGLFGGVRAGGAVNLIGIGLAAAGLGLRYWSRRVLGRFFTIGVVRQEGHRVVREGPYRTVRHPGYLGFLLFYTGLPLVVGSYVGLLLLSLPAAVVFVWLVVIEDGKMEAALGPDYTAYKADSARLLPGLW